MTDDDDLRRLLDSAEPRCALGAGSCPEPVAGLLHVDCGCAEFVCAHHANRVLAVGAVVCVRHRVNSRIGMFDQL